MMGGTCSLLPYGIGIFHNPFVVVFCLFFIASVHFLFRLFFNLVLMN